MSGNRCKRSCNVEMATAEDRTDQRGVLNEDEIQFALSPIHDSVSSEQQASVVELGKKRTPRRILHFSDGILEEYSTDEEEEEEKRKMEKSKMHAVDPSTLPWSKWMLHHLGSAASNTLSAADFCGEKLAWFFGVTSPKYEYVLDEIQRREMEEREEREREMREKEAEMRCNDQFQVTVEQEPPVAVKTSAAERGYDNLVFSGDETVGRNIQKY